jgi:hypothetical protein
MSNLPPINKTANSTQLINSVEQARAEKLTSLAKLVGLTVGNNVLASVERVEPIDAQQRDQLLQRTQEMLTQLQRLPQTPVVKAQIEQLVEQQQMLQSSQAKLAQLVINGKPLLIFSDRPMVQGQNLTIQLSESQRLLWSPQPSPTGNNTLSNADAARGQPDLQVNLSRPLNSSPLQTLLDIQGPDKKVQLQAGTDVKRLLADALRTLLPQQDQPRELFRALPQLQQVIGSHRQWIPPSLQQALKTAADQLRTPEQLSNPRLLQLALKNSGVFFEHKLASQLADADNGNRGPVPDRLSSGSGLQTSETQILTNRLTTQDLKGALLQLVHQIRVALADEDASSRSSTATTVDKESAASQPGKTYSASELILQKNLPSLLHFLQLLPQKQQELSSKQLRTQLLMLLHQQTLTSLARVQMQQVHTLNHQQAQGDIAQPSQSWIFELPVRLGSETCYLEISLRQDWVDEKSEQDAEGSSEKKRQWTVQLSFDLPEAGQFHAQLQVVDETVSARFWAEREETLTRVKSRLDSLRQQLESEGIKVTQLQCMPGKPASQRMSINYSLVDVTT